MKPHHIALKVCDLTTCALFYTEVLGLTLLQRHTDQNGELRSVWLDLDGTILMLELCSAGISAASARKNVADGMETGGWHILALQISPQSRTAWKKKLKQAGVAITGESPYSLYFRDPEDNNLALSHYPSPA